MTHFLMMRYLKCMLVFFTFCGFTFAKTPCVDMSNKLNTIQRESLQNNIKRQLKTEKLDVLEFFKEENNSIAYVETYDADEVFVFYSGDEFKNDFITMWSGAAEISEKDNLDKWAKDNIPGIPDKLARCFAWYAIYRHD